MGHQTATSTTSTLRKPMVIVLCSEIRQARGDTPDQPKTTTTKRKVVFLGTSLLTSTPGLQTPAGTTTEASPPSLDTKRRTDRLSLDTKRKIGRPSSVTKRKIGLLF